MPNPDALAVVKAAVSLARTHPQAPALDVLDVVMRGRADQVLDFSDPTSPHGSLAGPGTPFAQLVAAAFDEAMTPAEWKAYTGAPADADMRDGCLQIWRVYVTPRFAARYGVVVTGLP
jgi:hypothetical protein